ncbi:hypothetical protein JCM8097_003922 [Rhodosporidiobolus ruineniae]
MQSTGPFDPVYGTPGPPFSPPLANGTTLDASSSAALFSTGTDTGGAGEGMQRSASNVSTSSKGKQVDRSGSGEQQERARGGQDEANKDNHAIERVLKRAQANKLARTFRARLAQAGLKQQHGALGGSLAEPAMQYQHPGQPHLALGHPPPPPLPQAFSPHQQQQHFAPPPPLPPQQQHYVTVPAPSPYASQLSPYQLQQQQQQQQEQQNLYAAAQPLPHPGQQQHHHYAGGMDAMLDGGAQYLLEPHPHSHSQKRTRSAYDQQHQLLSPHPPLPPPPELPNSYNNASVYAPTPQPLPSASPYSTAGVYQSPSASVFAGSGLAGALGSPIDGAAARPNKRRHPSASAAPEGGSRIGMASPRARTKAGARRSPGKSIAAGNGAAPGQGPLSSSDPNFSSFVDAAAALTGMARAPSDPSQNGSDEDSSQQQQQANGANGAISAPPRPSTPERPGAEGGSKAVPGAPGSGGEAGAAEAADLMLYLAQSPSPVQPRRTAPVPGLGGDGERAGMKGRRLFSGVGELGGAGEGGFGGELGEAFGAGAGGLGEAFGEPTKPAGGAASALSALASELDTPLDLASALDGAAPATPGRTRQASFGGKGGGEPWETFINASPSPKRSSRRASGMGKAAKVAAATASEAGEAW